MATAIDSMFFVHRLGTLVLCGVNIAKQYIYKNNGSLAIVFGVDVV